MNRMTNLLLVGTLGALGSLPSACSSGESFPRVRVKHASLAFDIPADWQRTDQNQHGVATAVWQPDDSDRKESITVIRTELSPAVAKAGASGIEPYLAAAQRSLPDARVSKTKRITTAKGLHGARVDVEFTPQGQSEPYRRAHVVLVDGSALVHVLYTALEPDRDFDALGVVLDNLQHEGA
jgi:hypothetical protein